MKKNRKILFLVGALYFNSVAAGTMGNKEFTQWNYVVTLDLGPAWSTPGQTQTLLFLPNFPQTYVNKSTNGALGNGEIFLGLQRDITATLIAQMGLALAVTTPLQLKGDIWQDNDPEFNNFNYSYNISHSHIAIRGKLLKDMRYSIQPYVSGSLGVAFNHAYHFISRPKLLEVALEPPFHSNTNTAFTYTLDLGLQKKLNKNWYFGIGYEFADWGQTDLGRASSQESGTGLQLNHVYTNGLQFYLSFIA